MPRSVTLWFPTAAMAALTLALAAWSPARAKTADELLEQAWTLFRTDANEKSLAVLDRAVELGAEGFEVHYLRGRNLDVLERFTAAAESLEQALALAPETPDAWCYMARALGSRALALEAEGGVPNRAEAARLKAAAKAGLDRALELDIENGCANASLGIADIVVFNDFKSGREKLTRAVAAEPNRPEALVYLAWTLLRAGEHEQADKLMDRAAGLIAEDRPGLWFTMAKGYSTVERWDKALPLLELVVELEPGHERGEAQRLLRRARASLE